MGKIFDSIDASLQEFFRLQQMFFVATAPLARAGRVNLSPKGLDSFRVLGERTVAYADLTGSGIETVAQLKENGRIAIMFCAFSGAPRIVRLQGKGEVLEPGQAEFDRLRPEFPPLLGLRTIIRVDCERISDSCGYGVPLFEFTGHRSQLTAWADRMGPDKLPAYRREHNAASIDGLPGLIDEAPN